MTLMIGECHMVSEEKSISTSFNRENAISLVKEEPSLSIDGIQQEVYLIAEQWMARHYVLDTESLYLDCMRQLKDHGKNEIALAINDLVRKKILVNGAALTREKVLSNQNRASILALIKAKPGIHFSKIMEEIQTDPRTLQWHLKMLAKFDFIREERYGNKHAFFDFFLEKTHDILYYYLQKDGCSDIFRTMVDHDNISFVALLEITGLPRTTLARRIKTLIEANLIVGITAAGQLASLRIHDSCLAIIKNLLAKTTSP
jgi:predicted transcriptional regulator